MTTPQPIIFFVDFDGVFHHFFPVAGQSEAENAHFYYLPAFEEAVRQCGAVELVISSSWRNKYSLDQLRGFFSPDIAQLIIGKTPCVGSGNGDGGRQVEVEAWLTQNGREGVSWVGVDDYPELYSPGAAVVVCHDGFRGREAALLLEAAQDSSAFAQNHPIKGSGGPKKIIAVSGVR